MMDEAKELLEVISVTPGKAYFLRIEFSDGVTKEVDLTDLINAALPVFEPLKAMSEFNSVSVNPVGGIQWNCGADLSADYLASLG